MKNNKTKNKGRSGAKPQSRASSKPQSRSGAKPQSGVNSKTAASTRKATRGKVLEGVIDANLRGFGFFVCPSLEEDAFISFEKLNGAMHGDRVMAKIEGGGKGKRAEAVVVEILQRANERIVGTYRQAGRGGYVEPDNPRIARAIIVKSGSTKDALDNDKVVIEPDFDGSISSLSGKIVEVLGNIEQKNVDMLSIIRSYNLYESFPPLVEAEANLIADEVSVSEMANRVDYTSDIVITIDGEDSRDFDDAVCVKKLDGGIMRLYVHIADVAHYVKMASKLDKEAFKRGTSVYFPDMVFPMLPKKLSNGICSLNEGVNRLVLSVVMDIDKAGNVVKHKICEGVICSLHRMTYNKVNDILLGNKALCKQYSDILPMLEHMNTLASILNKKRQARGAIDFDIAESQLIMDEVTGKVVDIIKKPRLISHRIIEEFMLAANECIAEHMCKLASPFVYRAHESPPVEKLESLQAFLEALGISFTYKGESPTPLEYQSMLASLPEDYAKVVSKVALRAMAKATYEPQNIGHYGLSAKFYCHFTSPIRRYPDLVIHRIIKDYLKSGKRCFNKYTNFVADAAALSSERERLAEKAERDVVDMKKAQYMRDKIGEIYEGVVSGVTEFGLFVELENSVEGLIKVESLPGYYYTFNPALLRLSNGIKTFCMGDKLRVQVDSVTLNRVNFTLVP